MQFFIASKLLQALLLNIDHGRKFTWQATAVYIQRIFPRGIKLMKLSFANYQHKESQTK